MTRISCVVNERLKCSVTHRQGRVQEEEKKKVVKFVIIRHGLSIYNKEQRYTGQANIPLDEVGVRQAKCAGEYILKNYQIDAVYASDLDRAVETARPVAVALQLPIHTDEDLREIHVGSWQDLKATEVKERWPKQLKDWREKTGVSRSGDNDGESFAEVRERSVRVMKRIARENEGKTVLIATHGGFLRALCCEWMHIAPEDVNSIKGMTNASITIAEYDYKTDTAEFLQMGYDEYLIDKETEIVVQ